MKFKNLIGDGRSETLNLRLFILYVLHSLYSILQQQCIIENTRKLRVGNILAYRMTKMIVPIRLIEELYQPDANCFQSFDESGTFERKTYHTDRP